MIQLICLTALVLLIVVRGPRAVTSPLARPAWWATVSGVVALSTYGFPVPVITYDSLLGNSNVVTLVRDLAAISAFWFFREALARRAGSEGRFGNRWGLAVMFAACIIPFLFIENRAQTDAAFITDRLDQAAVWIYGSAYMASLVWISLSAVLLARRNWRGVQTVFIAGFLTVIIGCLLEIGYLTASHFGYGGQVFRYSAWDVSELPFFLGLLIIISGIIWVTIGTPSHRRILVAKLRRIAKQHDLVQPSPDHSEASLAVVAEKKLLARASELILLVDIAQKRGEFIPTSRETDVIGRARNLIAPDQAFRPMVFGKAV